MDDSKGLKGLLSFSGSIYAAHRHPASTALLEGASLRKLQTILATGLLVLVLPGVIAGIIKLLITGEFGRAIPGGPSATPGQMLIADAFLFTIIWLLYPLLITVARSWSMRFLGDGGHTYSQIFRLTWLAIWPMVFAAAVLRLLGILIPANAPQIITFIQYTVSGILFLGSVILDARFITLAHPPAFNQNAGRAFLTWIAPFAIWIVFVWVLVQILGFFA